MTVFIDTFAFLQDLPVRSYAANKPRNKENTTDMNTNAIAKLIERIEREDGREYPTLRAQLLAMG